MQNNTQGSLQDKFRDFGAAPGEPLWDSISASLDEDRKKRRAIWWWFLGAAAIVAVIVTVYQFGYKAGVNETSAIAADRDHTNDQAIENRQNPDKSPQDLVLNENSGNENAAQQS